MERPLPDYSQPLECDVAIVGAELSGIVTGAILANKGLRVVLVDEPPVIGGRGGSLEHRGYWLDGGHRAGRDVTDLMFNWHHGAEAAREAGVEVHVKPVSAGLRIHLVPAPGDPCPAEHTLSTGVTTGCRLQQAYTSLAGVEERYEQVKKSRGRCPSFSSFDSLVI